MEEAKRQEYLKAMGVPLWELRDAKSESSDVNNLTEKTEEVSTIFVDSDVLENRIELDHSVTHQELDTQPTNITTQTMHSSTESTSQHQEPSEGLKPLPGLTWLNGGSKNGLLVVLSNDRKVLTNEERQLMSKMLNGIKFLPSETGFASVSENINDSSPEFTLNSIKAILAFGQDAGRHLVRTSGAKMVAGTEVFTLDNKNIVITLHPNDLLAEPELKPQAWKDLKQLLEFFKD